MQSHIIIAIVFLCIISIVRGYALSFNLRDKDADMKEVSRAGAVILQHSTDEDLKQMAIGFQKCLTGNIAALEKIPELAEVKLVGEDITRRLFENLFFRRKRSILDDLYKRSRDNDIKTIIAAGEKLMSVMPADQVKQIASINDKLITESVAAQQEYVKIFGELARGCSDGAKRNEPFSYFR